MTHKERMLRAARGKQLTALSYGASIPLWMGFGEVLLIVGDCIAYVYGSFFIYK